MSFTIEHPVFLFSKDCLASVETNQPVLTPKIKDISDSFRLSRLTTLPCCQMHLTCDVCDQTIDIQKSLQGHVLKNHEAEANVKCDVCNKTFDTHKSLVRHILKDFTCDICDLTFDMHKSLQEHMLKNQLN